ncbi:MAG: hypothetical protein EP343_12585 [Deltaproteobacteria bacterium]|nr:MAG: hypothetical protein EP343_12585 [Deltaproteobacteria bacterium]
MFWRRNVGLLLALSLCLCWEWGCNIGVTLCKTGAECARNQRCIDKRCQAPPKEDNRPPVARAGIDQRVKKGGRIRLDGSTSSDADLDRLTYQWTFVKKPENSKAFIENAGNPQASFIADVSGTYEVKLTVTDGLDSSDDDTITVRANYPPQADAGGDQLVLPGSTVTLKGTDSWDTDTDDILTYQWSMIKKPNASKAGLSTPDQPISKFTVDQPGLYVVELRVSDGLNESTDSLKVQVADPGTLVPTLQALDPWKAPLRSIAKVALLGDNFVQGAKVFFDEQEIASEYRSRNRVQVVLDLQSVKTGAHKIRLQNPGGKSTESILFQVDEVPRPVLSKLSPLQGNTDQTVTLNVRGSGFVIGAKIFFDGKPLQTQYIDVTELQAKLTLKGYNTGKYEVFVENEKDKRSNSLLFEVITLPPTPQVYSHRFLQSTGGGSTSSGKIDTNYEYLQLTARGILSTTQVWVNDQPYGGKTNINISAGTTGNIFLQNFSTKGMKVGYLRITLKNVSAGQVVESVTYRIYLNNPYLPALRYLRFYAENGSTRSSGSTDQEYKQLDIIGSNYLDNPEVVIDGKKYTGSVNKVGTTTLRLQGFSTKNMKVGNHSVLVRNRVNGKSFDSNTLPFVLTDGRVPTISTVYTSDNSTTIYTSRTYTFLRITGTNFRDDTVVLFDGAPYKGNISNEQGTSLYLYQFSTQNLQPNAHTLVLRNVIQGKNYDSTLRTINMQEGNTPRIRSAYFRPSSQVYQNEEYQVTLNVENVLSGAKVLLDGQEYAGVVQTSPKTIVLPKFDTTGLSITTHVLQIRNAASGKFYDSNPYTFSVRKRQAPRISTVTPSLINQQQPVTMRVSGSYFSTTAKLLIDGKEVPTTSITTYRIDLQFDPKGWKAGRYDVQVVNSDGQKSNISSIYIAPNLGPALFYVNPNELHLTGDSTVAQTINLYLYGYNISAGASLYINGKLAGNITSPTGSGSYARTSLSTASLKGLSGEVTLTVKNTDGKESNKTEVTVIAPKQPEIYQVTPSSLSTATTQTMYIRGRGFSPSSEVRIDGKAFPATYSIITSQSAPYTEQFRLVITSQDTQSWGEAIKVEIRNPNGDTSKAYRVVNYLAKGVTGPIVSYTSPSNSYNSQANSISLYVTGQNFTPASTIEIDGKAIPTTYVSSRSLRSVLSLPGALPGRYYTVTVTDTNKTSNHHPLYFRRGPLISNITPPFLELKSTSIQTMTITGGGFAPGSTLKLFGRTYTTSSTSRITLSIAPQDLANVKAGLQTFSIVAPGGAIQGPTAGFHVVDSTTP